MDTELSMRLRATLVHLFPAAPELLTTEELLFTFGSSRDALLYAALFNPEFVIHSDSVLLAWSVSDANAQAAFGNAKNSDSANISEIEASFNFLEVGYLFDASGRTTDDEQDALLADLIARSWRCRLEAEYPQRRFSVEVLSPEQTGSTVGVHFFQVRA